MLLVLKDQFPDLPNSFWRNPDIASQPNGMVTKTYIRHRVWRHVCEEAHHLHQNRNGNEKRQFGGLLAYQLILGYLKMENYTTW